MHEGGRGGKHCGYLVKLHEGGRGGGWEMRQNILENAGQKTRESSIMYVWLGRSQKTVDMCEAA